jgi:hypothetical protein
MPRKHIKAEYSNKIGWQFVTSKSGNLPKVLIIKWIRIIFQHYTKTLKKARLFNRKVREAQNVYFFMRRRMIVQKKAICDNISSEKFAKNWQIDSKFLYLHI